MAPSRAGLTPLRRGLGATLVVLLLLGAIVYYWRAAPSSSVAASGPGAAASASPSGADADPGPSTPNPTPTPEVGGQSASVPAKPKTIDVYGGDSISARPFETIPIRGTYHGGADTFVHAERREGARWVAYPLRAKTDPLGRFVVHIELGAPGPHWVRVVDPAAKVASRDFVVSVTG